MSLEIGYALGVEKQESQEDCSQAALVARARSGDIHAFEALAEEHIKVVLGLVRESIQDSHAAEDVAQEALLIAFRKLRQLDDPSRFAAWLYRIALREAQRAAQSRRRNDPLPLIDSTAADVPSGEDRALNERRASVRQAVGELDEPYRLVVTLHYLEGLTSAEIAARLGMSHATVRTQLARALPMLKEKLGRYLS